MSNFQTLIEILSQHESQITFMNVLLLLDRQGHYSILLRPPIKENRIAHQMQEGFCTIIHPIQEYEVIGFVSGKEALQKLGINP